jgi:hypothetical protein
MTHRTEHVIIHKAREFLTAPLPGGGKRWHVAILSAVSALLGAWFF